MTAQHLKSLYARPALLAAVICIGLMVAGLYARPLFPVDETRYLTVAWEMHQSGNWVLPTLNHEAYHHKPPVLFWLINILWSIFGVSQSAAMAVPYLAAFALLMATARLATRLFPDAPQAPLMATAILAGSLPFVIYSNLIMFDLLLGVFAVLGVTAVWDYMTTRNTKHLVTLALCIGLGALTKGPAILLHIGTVILLARFWLRHPEHPLKKTIFPIILAILGGAALALLWAIPAAIEGGKEFADKIFWGQTAGRVVNAFDHQRPFYWYLTFAPLFALPWIASPALWRGIRSIRTMTAQSLHTRQSMRFLICWGVPVFLVFCLISGKQVHYLIPILPCLSLFFTAAFLNAPEELKARDLWPVLGTTALLALLPLLMKILAPVIAANINGNVHLEEAFGNTNVLPPIMLALLILGLAITIKGHKIRGLVTISLAMMLMMCSFQIAAKTGFFRNYDLTPIAAELQKIDAATVGKQRPLAYLRNYHGEFGFLARLDRPVKQLQPEELTQWLAENPDGIVFFRTKRVEEYARFHVLATMPYKLGSNYALVEFPR
ncbi:MAG: hypothetical protein AUJ12_04090 [Alphaproteobacteria bacterium CG1_02_46_17]|nr:MAG: hypothetical protein AUJ12_04090 [Alphaproteobacteria bacterium CG1_02_46_17]